MAHVDWMIKGPEACSLQLPLWLSLRIQRATD